LGEVTQAAAAFVAVHGAFNWLVDNYPRLAEWTSSAYRVGVLLGTLDMLDRPKTDPFDGAVATVRRSP
jgi:putative ATP-binding cassette transporter